MSVPDIPAVLADLPVVAGLVVPYVALEVDGRVRFGGVRGRRVAECLVYRLCQVCGEDLPTPMVFLVKESDLATRFSGEPAMHPVCAAYSARACPMVSGQMPHFGAGHSVDGQPCDVEGCDCAGWVSSSGPEPGTPAERWFRVWAADYAVAVREKGPMTVGNVRGALFTEPLKVRPVVAESAATNGGPQ